MGIAGEIIYCSNASGALWAAGDCPPWSWSDSVSSWNWNGYEGKPIAVEVYLCAEEVELILNGNTLGRQQGKKQKQI